MYERRITWTEPDPEGRCAGFSHDEGSAEPIFSELEKLSAENERLRYELDTANNAMAALGKQLADLGRAGKALVRALRFSSEWGNAVADMEKLVGEYKE